MRYMLLLIRTCTGVTVYVYWIWLPAKGPET
jgi:hypothetical protein